jgi:hypothetical protein
VGRDSAVGLVTRYGLRGPGIEIPLYAIYSAPIRTGPLSHPASYKVGNPSSFLGVERLGSGVDNPSLLALRLKKM